MKGSELIAQIQEAQKRMGCDPEVMLCRNINGGDNLKNISLGPEPREIYFIDEKHSEDCRGRLGENVIIIGA